MEPSGSRRLRLASAPMSRASHWPIHSATARSRSCIRLSRSTRCCFSAINRSTWNPIRGSADISVNCIFIPARPGRKDIRRFCRSMPMPIPSANGEYWHSDVSCDEEPPMGSILYLHTVPNCGGDTLFASQYAAYDALSPRMKVYLEGLTATHSGEHVYRATNVLVGRDDRGKVFPQASHPVIRTHPVSRRKALFVNQGFTPHIDWLPKEESGPILNYLFQHFTPPEFQVRFLWLP